MPGNPETKTPEGAPGKKDLYKAVSNYLSNELGIDRNYVDRVIAGKIEARNVEAQVRQAVAAYFHKGPTGWRADDFVRDAIKAEIDKHVQAQLKSGAGTYLNALIQQHVDQICAASGAARPVPGNEDAIEAQPGIDIYRTAVVMSQPAVDQAMADWADLKFTRTDPGKVKLKSVQETDHVRYELSGLRYGHPDDLMELAAGLSGSDRASFDFAATSLDSRPFRVPAHMVLEAINMYRKCRNIGFTAKSVRWLPEPIPGITSDKKLLCLPAPVRPEIQ